MCPCSILTPPTETNKTEALGRLGAEWHTQFASEAHTPETSSPASSNRASETTSVTRVSLDETESMLFSALCIYAFDSSDPSHLSFRENEILNVIVQEDSGWWAAHRQTDSEVIGWIPGSFVQRLSFPMAQKLSKIPERLRTREYQMHVTHCLDTAAICTKTADEGDQVS